MELFISNEEIKDKKIVIYLPGIPSIPKQQAYLKKICDNNTITIQLRYAGSWESDGRFIDKNFIRDLHSLLDTVARGSFIDIIKEEKLTFNINETILLGSSFGSFVVMEIIKNNPLINKAILFSPIFSLKQLDESLNHRLYKELLTELEINKNVYRMDITRYKNLMNDQIIGNHTTQIEKFKNARILMFQGEDDELTPSGILRENIKLFNKINLKYKIIFLKNTGHNIFSSLKYQEYKIIKEFIKNG